MENRHTGLSNEELVYAAGLDKRRRKRRKIIRVIVAWLFAIFMLAVIAVGAVAVYMAIGGNSLRRETGSNQPKFEEELTEESQGMVETSEADAAEEAVVWQEGWVRHNGKIYEYKENIMTFLVLGIDKHGEVEENQEAYQGGQSDAIFLVVVDPTDKAVRIIAVNRDTITDVQMIDEKGVTSTIQAQIAVQYGFGDGMEQSCELTKEAVSQLFYELPIHGYVSVNMDAIAKLNDAVGGVEVTVLEDLPKVSSKFKKGEQITLKGQDAYDYIHYRDITVFESNRGRLARQKQYINAYIDKAIEATKKDITFPISLYEEFSKYMVTDITTDEVAYLAGKLITYRFDENAIYTMEGTTEMGKRHEEFYYDTEALKELMIQIFYQEVERY